MSAPWRKWHHLILLQVSLAGIFTSLWQENREFPCCETFLILSSFLTSYGGWIRLSHPQSQFFPNSSARPIWALLQWVYKALCFSHLINRKIFERQDLASFGLTIACPEQCPEPKGAECAKSSETEAWCGLLAAGGTASISCHLDSQAVINQLAFFSVCPWALSFLFVFICLPISNVYRDA